MEKEKNKANVVEGTLDPLESANIANEHIYHIHDFTLFNSSPLEHLHISTPLKMVVSISIQCTISFSPSTSMYSSNPVLHSVPLTF